MSARDYCLKCQKLVFTVEVQKAGIIEWHCKECGAICDSDFLDDDDYRDGFEE